jgi:hypothetical protein
MIADVKPKRARSVTRSAPALPDGRRPAGARAPLSLRLLGVTGMTLAFALAFYSLFQPWAQARLVLVLGITRSAGATALVFGALAAALAAGIGLALHGRRPRTTGWVHLAMGLLLAVVSWKAYVMIRAASVRALFVPIASVHRGPGWFTFTGAAIVLLLLGACELALAERFTRRHRRAAACQAPPAVPETAAV